MKLHLLGTAGYHPNEHRHTACFMIPEAGVVLDAGTGFFRVRELIQTRELHIFLSHAHLDHCVGLSFYLDVLHETNVQNVFVYGVSEKLEAVKSQLFSEHLFPLPPHFEWVPIDIQKGATGIGLPLDGTITWCPLKHPGSSLGYRLEWPGSSLAYITDTTASPQADYVSFINKAGTLIHECNFPDGFEELAAKTGHSCVTPVAEVCRSAEVERCTLVHMNPMMDDPSCYELESVSDIYAPLAFGHDGMTIEF